MSNYQFTYAEVNLMRQWFNHIQDTAHKDYFRPADIALGEKLVQICRNRRHGPADTRTKPEELYKWFRCHRVPSLSDPNVSFIYFNCYESPSGKLACQVLEGMGVNSYIADRPALVVHLTPRYFKNVAARKRFIQRIKDYWELK